ncbi:sulfurtransferase TusA family protein [bacterium]|nr:sulfurtransferase TusA family protein [bacterium]
MNGLQADFLVDVSGENCPIPLIEMRKAMAKAREGQIVEIRGTHQPSKHEIPMAVRSLRLRLLGVEEDGGQWRIFIKKEVIPDAEDDGGRS